MLPLRVRSYYSLMRGLMSPAEICRRARAFGNPSVALTDRDNLYGLWQFLAACKREKLRPIIGSEVSEPGTDRMATCLVKSETGYNNLCRLLSRRHADKHFQLAEELPHHTEGLLILSQDREVLEALQRLGLNPVADLGAWPVAQSSKLKKWAEKSGIRATATHDCGIAEPEHAEIYMLLRAIDTNTSISKIREELAHASIASFAAPNIYEERFAMWPEVIEESHRLASLCDFTGPKFDLVMPPWEGDDPDTTLREWAYSGARRRYGADLGEIVVERLEHELQVIASMGFSSYFLVVRNIVHRLEENGRRKKRRICGRGSGRHHWWHIALKSPMSALSNTTSILSDFSIPGAVIHPT